MSILDISNWTIDEINNSIDTFKDTSLTDIGMVNCDIESINIVGGITTATLWIDEDIGIDGYTGAAPLKIYKEDKIELRLNSPLLEGDTIEVVDGKLCHVHRYEKVVLDGSENWTQSNPGGTINIQFHTKVLDNMSSTVDKSNGYCDTKKVIPQVLRPYKVGQNTVWMSNGYIAFIYPLDTISLEDFKQWLSENPTTVVYRLASPYYEDITPLQSSIILKTFLESSMIINTNLPIKANVSYRTNVPSISTLSNRVAEVSESDSVIQNLIDIIDDEVDE